MLIVGETKKWGDNIVAVVSSSFIYIVDLILLQTGDGVNDAPALRASDIDIIMGRYALIIYPISKSILIILLNYNFSSIPVTIESGVLCSMIWRKLSCISCQYVTTLSPLFLCQQKMQARTYTEFITVFANVFLGM